MQPTVRPVRPDDKDRLADFVVSLSEDSRYRRFFGPKRQLSPAELRFFSEVDHRDHEALVALEDGGRLVGVARYIRLADEPAVAEVAVVVSDEWQQHRVGTELVTRLAAHAVAHGIECFRALSLTGNASIRALLAGLGPGHVVSGAGGVLVTEVPLPAPRAQRGRSMRYVRNGSTRAPTRS